MGNIKTNCIYEINDNFIHDEDDKKMFFSYSMIKNIL
jgi:hypothetical protein